jgi:hypothetical protein
LLYARPERAQARPGTGSAIWRLGPEEYETPPGSADVAICGTRQRHAKSNVFADDARDVPVTIGAAHVLKSEPEGAAPPDAGRVFRGLQILPLCPCCSPCGVGIVSLQAPRPLPDVTTQLFYTIGTDTLRKAPYRTRCVNICSVVVGPVWIRVVASGIGTSIHAACCLLPLGLTRQHHAPALSMSQGSQGSGAPDHSRRRVVSQLQ